jgi:hypothetical protein
MDGECNPADLDDEQLGRKEKEIMQRSPPKKGTKQDDKLDLECKNGECLMPDDWAEDL